MENLSEPNLSGSPLSVEGIVTRPSPFSVEETLERLQAAIRARNLTLFAHIDHQAEAERVGLTMQAAHVLIFGNPKGGTPLMVASPLLALDLPLKVLVWQSQDRQVWVSSMQVDFLRERYALPPELAGNLAAGDMVIEAALTG
jgi:uncharacterized protein (DUF302 family)